MHYSNRFFILFLISLAYVATSSAQGISMSPTRLFFSGKPGEVLTQTVTISNSSAKEITFNIHTKDWKREESGEKIYSVPGSLEKSNSAWVSTLESTINIQPGTTKELQVTLRVPENASTEDVTNSMLFFTQIGKLEDDFQQDKNIGIRALFEFGLHVYFTPVGNANQSLEFMAIDDVNVNKGEFNELRKIGIRIKNDGNVVCDATVELELTNKNTGSELQFKPISISMMPEAEQVVYFDLPADVKGSFLGVSIIKMGGTNDLRVGEKDFEF